MFSRFLAVARALVGIMVAAAIGAIASQNSLFSPTTGTVTGLNLTNNFNNALDSLYTLNSGASAPTNQLSGVPSLGNLWLDTSVSPKRLKVYDGTSWVIIASLDDTNHYWVPVTGGGSVQSIASASTTDLCSSNNNYAAYVSITGTTTITSFGSNCQVGQLKVGVFTGALTFTHNATSLILPNNGSNIKTAAGDMFSAVYLGSGNWRVLSYQLASGNVLTNGISATIASASTVNIGASAADYIAISGTTTITAFDTVPAGIQKTLEFQGALTLTYNATSLILPGLQSITTAAGDTAIFRSEGSGNWRAIAYTRAAGNTSGNRVLLNTLTASSSASLADTTSLTSTYDTYEIVIADLVPATDATDLRFRSNVGGVKTSGYISEASIFNGSAVASDTVTTYIPLSVNSGSVHLSNTNTGYNGRFTLQSPSGSGRHVLFGLFGYKPNSVANAMVSGLTTGRYDTDGAMTGFELTMSSGNITSGTVLVYGVVK